MRLLSSLLFAVIASLLSSPNPAISADASAPGGSSNGIRVRDVEPAGHGIPIHPLTQNRNAEATTTSTFAESPDGKWARFPPFLGRTGHTAVYDPLRNRVIVFGGTLAGDDYAPPRNDCCALSPCAHPMWSDLPTMGTPPPGRYGHVAVYDPIRDRMIVFGGRNYFTQFNDVWELSLSGTPTWSEITASGPVPPARSHCTAVYDSAHDGLVMLGGYADGETGLTFFKDVWLLPLSGKPAWSALTVAGLPPYELCVKSEIYDPEWSRVILFGGGNNETWALSIADSPEWSRLSPMGMLPSPRFGHTAIYDPGGRRMIVHGGSSGTSLLNDTWALSLGDSLVWFFLSPLGSLPPPRQEHFAIYDPLCARMVTFGGSGGLNDSWALSLSQEPAWSTLTPSEPFPRGRAGHTAVYDPLRDRMLICGGESVAYSYSYLSDIW